MQAALFKLPVPIIKHILRYTEPIIDYVIQARGNENDTYPDFSQDEFEEMKNNNYGYTEVVIMKGGIRKMVHVFESLSFTRIKKANNKYSGIKESHRQMIKKFMDYKIGDATVEVFISDNSWPGARIILVMVKGDRIYMHSRDEEQRTIFTFPLAKYKKCFDALLCDIFFRLWGEKVH